MLDITPKVGQYKGIKSTYLNFYHEEVDFISLTVAYIYAQPHIKTPQSLTWSYCICMLTNYLKIRQFLKQAHVFIMTFIKKMCDASNFTPYYSGSSQWTYWPLLNVSAHFWKVVMLFSDMPPFLFQNNRFRLNYHHD